MTKRYLIHKVERPGPQSIYIADQNDAQMSYKLHQENQATVFIPQAECVDFVREADGNISGPYKSITINGFKWHLSPGKNRVPSTVYEFI
jgi:hypothetical protein